MKRVVIFGAGGTGERLFYELNSQYEILWFTDNDSSKYGTTLCGLKVRDKSHLLESAYDFVIIGTSCGVFEVEQQLINEFLIPQNKIMSRYAEFDEIPRIAFLKKFAELAKEKNLQGSVCEVGVFRGEFAKHINYCFPEKTLYLFDTFEGFDERDIVIESDENFSVQKCGHLNITSIDLILSKMPYRNKCEIRKGYFPETFDLTDCSFCFVNLDPDLYQPIKCGLEIFYPLLVEHGVILIHDYFSKAYKGAKKAVDEFAKQNNLTIIPIGDNISVAIVK